MKSRRPLPSSTYLNPFCPIMAFYFLHGIFSHHRGSFSHAAFAADSHQTPRAFHRAQ